jgi:alkyldihydroxyacetonephosphate synthase
MARWQKLKHAASLTIAENRGTISHQHGVGRDHAPYLPIEKGELGMATLKALAGHFDPEQRLAPGVLSAGLMMTQWNACLARTGAA